MPDFDRNELTMLEHFKGEWKRLKTLEELPKTTLYRKKDKLLKDDLIDERQREGEPGSLYKTSEKGVRALEESEAETEGIPQAELAPTPEHRAMIELILAAVASRQAEFRTSHHPSFVQVGGTLKWKSWLAKFVSGLLDLDPDDSVILMSSESGRSLLTRRGHAGETVSQRDILDMSFVCFDEYHKADNEQKKLCSVYLQGKTTISYENEELEIEPVPLVNLNPQGEGSVMKKTGMEQRQVRRSITCDLDQVKIPDSEKTEGEEILRKVEEKSIAVPDQVPDLSAYRGWIQRAVNECVREEYRDLVDLEMLILLASGMGGFLDEGKAVSRTVRNYFQVIDTLGWTDEGWPRILNLLTDELKKEGEQEKEREEEKPERKTLGQRALKSPGSSEPSPLDYDTKLAKLKEELDSHELEREEALTVIEKIGKRCEEEGKEAAEAVEEILDLMDEYESVKSSLQSKEKKLSDAREKLSQSRERESKLEEKNRKKSRKTEKLEKKLAEEEERRKKLEEVEKLEGENLSELEQKFIESKEEEIEARAEDKKKREISRWEREEKPKLVERKVTEVLKKGFTERRWPKNVLPEARQFIKQGIKERFTEEREAKLEEEAEKLADEKVEELKEKIWTEWYSKNVEPNIDELEEAVKRSAIEELENLQFTLKCDECGTEQEGISPTEEEAHKLLTKGKFWRKCANPDCIYSPVGFDVLTSRHKISISFEDLALSGTEKEGKGGKISNISVAENQTDD